MRNFTEAEFRGWYPYLHPLLKERLDDYRDERGDSVMISPVDGALGRRLDPNNPAYRSRHNIELWKLVMAADVMPLVGGQSIPSEDLEREYEIAREVGFTGIGAYPDWKPHPGLHLDVRDNRQVGYPATWSGLKVEEDGRMVQRYFGIDKAWT